MRTPDAKPKAGLEDTVATSSAICFIDGDRGVLSYCGYDIHELARHATFEEVCYLLWHRRLPTRAELGDLQSQLVAARQLPEAVIRAVRMLPPGDSMDALRTLTSILAHHDPDATDTSPAANPSGSCATRSLNVSSRVDWASEARARMVCSFVICRE